MIRQRIIAAEVATGRGPNAALCTLAVSALLAVLAPTAAFAQQGWEPVVATAEPARLVRATSSISRSAPGQSPRPPTSPAVEVFMRHTHVAQRQPAAAAPSTVPTPAPPRPRQSVDASSAQPTAVQQYCANIANPAAEARFAWQKQALVDIERQLSERIALLDAKMAELQKWVTRRDEFIDKARQNLVQIYTRMRPDAAASQLSAMDEETASAVLLKLEPRTASLILNEMEPTQAARLTTIIGGAARSGSPRPQTAEPEKRS
jgi:flagellar motility protein MotE (MotC chaperone)